MFKSQVLKLFRKAFGPWVTAAPPRRRERPTFKPRLEGLENRIVPTQAIVSNLNPNGEGSLDAAIRQVNGSTDPSNQIIFQGAGASGTITLTAALQTINKNVDILGPGASTLTVTRDPNANTAFGIFKTAANTTVSITGLTISGGSVSKANGGGIYNAGKLTLTNDDITDNTVTLGKGGGIYNSPTGSVTLSGTSVLINSAVGGYGGGIYNDGTVNLTNESGLMGNTADVSGGGIAQSKGTTLIISSSTIYGNTASSQDGGGIWNNNGTVQWNGGALQNNDAGSNGGGLAEVNGGTATLTNVQITNKNTAQLNGGGIYALQGTVNLNNCTLSGNQAGKIGAGGAYKNGQGFINTSGGTITDPIQPF